MARPKKDGLDYYPMDSDIENDDKMKFIRSKHGNDGFATVILLLNKIYRENGYFCKWTNFEKTIFAADVMVEIDILDAIIDSCFECHFFDKTKHVQYNILTSKGVQNRFMEASKRRKGFEVVKQYILDNVDINYNFEVFNVDNNSSSDDINANHVRNNGESKVKGKVESKRESKVESSKKEKTINITTIIEFYENNGFGTLSSKNQEDFAYWIKDFEQIGATNEDAIDLIIFALGQAVDYNKRSYAYANTVLRDWEQKRFITVDQVKASKKQRTAANQSLPPIQETGLDWQEGVN